MFRFPLTQRPQTSREPFSLQTLAKASRLRGATVTESVCPYCAVGCGQLIYTKGGELIDIEGDPDSPISGGHLCPKGANAFQLAVNSHRVRHVLYRAPNSDHWETKTMDWALDQIAQRVKAARDADFTTRDEQGRLLNSVRGIGTLGGATIVAFLILVRGAGSCLSTTFRLRRERRLVARVAPFSLPFMGQRKPTG